MKDFTSYTVQDFILDKDFQRWVIEPDEETRSFWENWLKMHPEKKEEAIEAKAFIKGLPFNYYQLSQEDDLDTWTRINSRLSTQQAEGSADQNKEIKRFPIRWYRYAAIVFLPLLAGFIYYLAFSSQETFTTGYGEKLILALPDGSQVMLNANSALEFKNNWQQGQVREVWLKGEAFFEVNKISLKQEHQPVLQVKFIVHTPQVDVEVLGTKFNVKNRSKSTEVVLNSGKILLRKENEAVTLLPGEMVKVTDQSSSLSKEIVNVEIYSAWKKEWFVFNNSSLKEVVAMLEETYGYEVDIGSSEILIKKITSTAPISTRNIDAFLEMLEKLYGVKITKTHNVIQIEKDKPVP